MVHQLTGAWFVVQRHQVRPQRLINRVTVDAQQPYFLWRERVYVQLDLCQESQRAFGASDQFAKVEVFCAGRKGF